jgi:hypothetical protein
VYHLPLNPPPFLVYRYTMSGPGGARRKAQMAKAQKEEEFLSQFTLMKCDMPEEVRTLFSPYCLVPHIFSCPPVSFLSTDEAEGV